MLAEVEIADVAIWFKHVSQQDVLRRLKALAPEEEITLEADNVVGRWRRMKTGSDGREVAAIRPVGAMKTVWSEWYRTRRGQRIVLRPVVLADDYLAATSGLFSEWSSPEDEEAFRDL